MNKLFIIKTGINDEFKYFTAKCNNGGAMLKAAKEFKLDGDAWMVKIIDLKTKRLQYTITA